MHNLQSIYTIFINLYYYKREREICQQSASHLFYFLILSHIKLLYNILFMELSYSYFHVFLFLSKNKRPARQERVDS